MMHFIFQQERDMSQIRMHKKGNFVIQYLLKFLSR